jgi:hypothetical protein
MRLPLDIKPAKTDHDKQQAHTTGFPKGGLLATPRSLIRIGTTPDGQFCFEHNPAPQSNSVQAWCI